MAQRGLLGTSQMCWGNLIALLRPASRNIEAQRQQVDAIFDQQNGVETSGIVRPGSQSVIGNNWAYGIRYQAIDPASFLQALREVPIPHPNFTFIDFGSGKGRALLLAAQFPFKRIIGIEYCDELNEIARKNLVHSSAQTRQCDSIEIIRTDAAEYRLPNEPLALYFFNPFGKPVMQRVVENVTHSFQTNPRRVIVIYFTPYFDHLWEETGFLKRVQSSPAIFDTGPINNASDPDVVVKTE